MCIGTQTKKEWQEKAYGKKVKEFSGMINSYATSSTSINSILLNIYLIIKLLIKK